jgi:Protein of unknown function (DUF3995)
MHTLESPDRARRAALQAFAWTAVFIVWHAYWALGGDFGFGDEESLIPDTTSSLAGWVFTVAVAGMFAAGLAVPLAIARGAGPRRLLAGLMWAGAAVLVLRGAIGLVDDVLRFTGLAETGVSGLSDEQVLGTADPSAYTIWSTVGLDSFFAAGGLLFAWAAHRTSGAARAPWRRLGASARRLGTPWRRLGASARRRYGDLGWAAYAACGWAVAYAIGVRGYQGLGGTVGLPGTFEDPGAFHRASLLAGAFILLVGLGSLAFVRSWGLRLPRWLVILPALAGSAFSAAHALTAYVTKPLHVLGVIHLDFGDGWKRVDEGSLIRWDLFFYELWFLGLGILVTLGAVHHFRRTGGSPRGERRLLLGTAAAAVVTAAFASVSVAT